MSASVCLKVFPRIYKKCGAGRAAGLAARPGGLCAFFSKSSLRSAAPTLVNEKQTPLSTLSPSFSFLFLSLPSPHLLPSNFSRRRVAGAGAGQPEQAGSAGAGAGARGSGAAETLPPGTPAPRAPRASGSAETPGSAGVVGLRRCAVPRLAGAPGWGPVPDLRRSCKVKGWQCQWRDPERPARSPQWSPSAPNSSPHRPATRDRHQDSSVASSSALCAGRPRERRENAGRLFHTGTPLPPAARRERGNNYGQRHMESCGVALTALWHDCGVAVTAAWP